MCVCASVCVCVQKTKVPLASAMVMNSVCSCWPAQLSVVGHVPFTNRDVLYCGSHVELH